MDKKIVLVSLIVLLSIIYYKRNIGVIEKMSVVEAFNRKKFLVRDLNDKKESADLLAKLMENLKLLISTLKNTNNINDRELQKFKPFIETIYNRIDDVKVRENEGGNDLTSYSINKGEELVFCIRSKQTTSCSI